MQMPTEFLDPQKQGQETTPRPSQPMQQMPQKPASSETSKILLMLLVIGVVVASVLWWWRSRSDLLSVPAPTPTPTAQTDADVEELNSIDSGQDLDAEFKQIDQDLNTL